MALYLGTIQQMTTPNTNQRVGGSICAGFSIWCLDQKDFQSAKARCLSRLSSGPADIHLPQHFWPSEGVSLHSIGPGAQSAWPPYSGEFLHIWMGNNLQVTIKGCNKHLSRLAVRTSAHFTSEGEKIWNLEHLAKCIRIPDVWDRLGVGHQNVCLLIISQLNHVIPQCWTFGWFTGFIALLAPCLFLVSSCPTFPS